MPYKNKEDYKKYYQRNKEERLEYQRKYYIENKEERKEYHNKRYKQKKAILEYQKKNGKTEKDIN
jgi:hypothetical protein